MATGPVGSDRAEIAADLERARIEFHRLLDATGPDDWSRPTRWTRWTNEELLFHKRRLARESDDDFRRGMHYPTRWDPFFADYMTLADLYRYPGQHFDFHARQLTLTAFD